MRAIFRYIRAYCRDIDKRMFATAACFIALGIFINFYYGLNNWIRTRSDAEQYGWWYLVFTTAFIFPYILQPFISRKALPSDPGFYLLLLMAPVLFAWKMVYLPQFAFSGNEYENAIWNSIAYWPFKLLILCIALALLWALFDRQESRLGLSAPDFKVGPYLTMLLLMTPLIAAAATQPDFLATYPKLKNIVYPEQGLPTPLQKLLYELSYGSDFFGIELFFRGFLVLTFARWADKNAILPMALFYCTIHFGKPLGECISSFFGGLLLGIITYHTRTIWGGLIVHLGIAWMMEVGGYLGNMMRMIGSLGGG